MTAAELKKYNEKKNKSLRNIYYVVAFVFATALLATEYILTNNGVI